MIADLATTDVTRCPCGWTRRAFAVPENSVATMHLLELTEDSQTHYHKTMTELYLILEGKGHIELDGERFAVKPMTAVMIKPFCRHRAVGKLKIIVVPIPAFNPADEYFD